MEKRQATDNGLEASAIGLGCMGMSEFYGPADDAKSIPVIQRALELGVTFLDTADMYGSGENEKLLARALDGRRDQAIVCTKFAFQRGEGGSFTGLSGSPEYVKQACEASLRRLRMDHIDLYYQHRVDPQVPIEDTVGAMSELVKEGKVRFLGLSEANPDTLRRASKVHPISALQTELSLWSRAPERELIATCKEIGALFVAYSPLGRGFLSGKIRSRSDLTADDYRLTNPRFSEENFDENLALVDRVQELAQSKGCTAAQLALAWVLSRGEHVVSIPGTRDLGRLEQNAGAAAVTLTADELGTLDAILPPDAAAGGRYTEMGMAMVDA